MCTLASKCDGTSLQLQSGLDCSRWTPSDHTDSKCMHHAPMLYSKYEYNTFNGI